MSDRLRDAHRSQTHRVDASEGRRCVADPSARSQGEIDGLRRAGGFTEGDEAALEQGNRQRLAARRQQAVNDALRRAAETPGVQARRAAAQAQCEAMEAHRAAERAAAFAARRPRDPASRPHTVQARRTTRGFTPSPHGVRVLPQERPSRAPGQPMRTA